jgi:predicted PurR-regulated permease PerM
LQPERLAAVLGSIFTQDTAAAALSVTLSAFETIFTVVTVFVIAYFWLEERTRIRRLVARSLRPEHRERALRIWEDVETRLGAWLRGQLLLMGIIGTAQGVAYLVLGVPFALLLAVFAGLMEAIPMVGPFLGAIPAILIALTISPQLALILVAYTVLVHLVEGNVLVPRVMERAVGLTPLSVILALLVGTSVAGILGALLAIPVAAAVQAAIVDLVSTSDAAAPTPETTEIELDEKEQKEVA